MNILDNGVISCVKILVVEINGVMALVYLCGGM